MSFHDDKFCRGIALVLRGESMKASAYVDHNTSIGTIREKIVGNFIRHDTPERFRVETGLIRSLSGNHTTRQCDLLVHEPGEVAPIYRYDDFVVVDASAARAVVEVKSELGKQDFEALLDVHASVIATHPVNWVDYHIPTFGFGLNGSGIDKVAEYLTDALVKDRLKALGLNGHAPHLNWPMAIAIQGTNLIGVRPNATFGPDGPPICFCLIDFSKDVDANGEILDGVETGLFLRFYDKLLNHYHGQFRSYLLTQTIYSWFNDVPVADDRKRWIEDNGTVHHGRIAFPSKSDVS